MSDTIISRLLLAHPDLGTAGGAALHTEIETIYTKIGDNMDSRYFSQLSLANGSFVDFTHNFSCDISNLRYDLYTISGGVLTRVAPPFTGYTIAATPSFTNTKIRVTNSTGSSKDIALTVIQDPFFLDECTDVDLSTTPQDGQALVYDLASLSWKPGASGDASFKLQAISSNVATVKAGSIFLADGRELYLAADDTLNLKTAVNTNGVTSPGASTAYYAYLDLNALPAQTSVGLSDRKVYAIATGTTGPYTILAVSPENVDLTRYVPLWSLKTDGSSNYLTTTFANLAFRRHNPMVQDQSRNYFARLYRPGSSVGTVISGTVTDTGNRTTDLDKWHTTSSANISISASTSSPLRELSSYLTTGSANNATGTTFIESPATQLDLVDGGKAVVVAFDLNGNTADGNFDVCMVRYNSSGVYQEKIAIAGNASSATFPSAKLPTGTTSFKGFFLSSSTQTDYYALRVRRLAGTDNIRLDSLFIGPNSLGVSPAIEDWKAFTPTGAFTTNSTYTGFYRRIGDSIECLVQILFSGAPNSVTCQINLPTGLVIDTTKVVTEGPTANTAGFGYGAFRDDSAGVVYPTVVAYNTTTSVKAIYQNTNANGLAGNNFNSASPVVIANLDSIVTRFTVPIANWSSNVTIADRAVEEYAYNSSTTDANDSSSFAAGPVGGQFGSFTALRTKRVQFSSPIQPTDILTLEVTGDSGVTWSPVGQSSVVHTFQQPNGVFYGAYVDTVSQTQAVAVFGQYRIASGATYAAAGTTWAGVATSNQFRWRIKKVSGGGLVGFPIAPANIAFLNTADNYSGNTKMGLMVYRHGTTYNGGNAPTVTGTAGFALSFSSFRPYQMADGTWFLHFNIHYSHTASATADISVNGITAVAFQPITVRDLSGTFTAGSGQTSAGSSMPIRFSTTNSGDVAVSGNIELASKPTWAY